MCLARQAGCVSHRLSSVRNAGMQRPAGTRAHLCVRQVWQPQPSTGARNAVLFCPLTCTQHQQQQDQQTKQPAQQLSNGGRRAATSGAPHVHSLLPDCLFLLLGHCLPRAAGRLW